MGLPRVQYNQSSTQDSLITELASPASQWSKIKTSHSLTTSLAHFFSKIHARMQLHPHSMNSGWLAQLLKYLHIRVHSPSLANASDSLISTHVAHNLSLPRSSQSLDTSVSGVFVSGKSTIPEPVLRTREEFIEELIADQAKFNEFVYTDFNQAIEILKSREVDLKLDSYVSNSIPQQLSSLIMGTMKLVVYFRQLITPNFEAHRYIACADIASECKPIILELHDDKFTDVNVLKRALGKLIFHRKIDKNDKPIVQYQSIIDMSKWNGRKISDITTIYGGSLVNFHRNFFLHKYPNMKDNLVDISDLIGCSKGENASQWYKGILSLFLQHGFLLENFSITDQDLDFTKNVFLPAFISIYEETGYKPIIVALEPTHIEGNQFWISYPHNDLETVKLLLNECQ